MNRDILRREIILRLRVLQGSMAIYAIQRPREALDATWAYLGVGGLWVTKSVLLIVTFPEPVHAPRAAGASSQPSWNAESFQAVHSACSLGMNIHDAREA